jgi:RNA polymerase sigma-70 factor (ECF subfamily)
LHIRTSIKLSTKEKYDDHSPLSGEEAQAVWQAFTRDDEMAPFEWLYRHFITTLLDYGYKMCNEKWLAEDAVQNVFTYLLQHRRRLPTPQSVKYYLLRCVRNELLKLLRRHQRELPNQELFDTLLQLEPTPETPALEACLQKEQLTTLQHYINQLPNRQREVIYLRFFHGLSYAEIAAIMEIDQKSAYKTIYKALDTLRQLLPGPSLGCLYILIRASQHY